MAFKKTTAEHFARYIERQVTVHQMSYMDAILHFCEQRQIEPDQIAPFINGKIKSRLNEEGQRLNILPKSGRLPLD